MTSIAIDFGAIARQFQLEESQVSATAELLDEGNTIPFITRYRKDRTGGLDEEKIRLIEEAVVRRRQLEERKERVLRTVQSQEKLTPELEERIRSASSLKVLDDLYLPYRPKKQTLATLARQRGLEPVAMQILEATADAAPIETLFGPLVDPSQELATTADVMTGIGHIVAEVLSERPDLRTLARKHLWNGQLFSKRIEPTDEDAESLDEDDAETLGEQTESDSNAVANADAPAETASVETTSVETANTDGASVDTANVESPSAPTPSAPTPSAETPSAETPSAETTEDSPTVELSAIAIETVAADTSAPADVDSANADASSSDASEAPAEAATPETSVADASDEVAVTADEQSASTSNQSADSSGSGDSSNEATANAETPAEADASAPAKLPAEPATTKPSKTKKASLSPAELAAEKRKAAEQRREQRREARHRKRQKLEQSFKDYFDYSEPIKKLPHYRVLAVNRGERCKVLRVRIQYDATALKDEAQSAAVPDGHPYSEFLKESLHDALNRLVVPSIEREVRRELTERAESHAVKVFAQNLRKLLLQSPLRDRRVLAIDPGFRSGCKLTALDEFGSVLSHSLIHVIGAAERVQQSRARMAEMIRTHGITVVAIGNGTACRETEQLVAGVLTEELADVDVKYLIVNEAGASVYSTSQIGREELPRFDATVRGAVSIGRRALDPLSELVKIDPASIGVGLYQHDVKAKHLRVSLDAVVESCVNFVGVDVNSASPALLGYVSGLNQLTARRVYEYRQNRGPFANREQLKEVPGVGDATFVQAAGFLKIVAGDNPLDATWIHPESYDIARQVLAKLGFELSDLAKLSAPKLPPVKETPAARKQPASVFAHKDGVASIDAVAPPETVESQPTPVDQAVQADPSSTDSPPTEADVSAPDATPSTDNPPTGDQPTTVESAAAEAVPAASDSETPVVADAPAAEVPAAEVPATETPATETPTSETDGPVADASSAEPASPESAETETTPPVESVLAEKLASVDAERLADELGVGVLLLKDILASLARPGRDPREDLRPPIFRREVLKLEDLKPGMELSGTVLNVVDFGAFVDIGLSDSGLIHISRLANRYVADPHEVASVGDILNVWVVDVDEKRRRVSLTAIAPGTEAPEGQAQESQNRRRPSNRRGKGQGQGQGQGQAAGSTAQQGRRRGGGGNRGAANRGGGGGGRTEGWRPRPKKAPKPAAPITDAMVDGKEPMRTFSDLQQFFETKKKGDPGKGGGSKKK